MSVPKKFNPKASPSYGMHPNLRQNGPLARLLDIKTSDSQVEEILPLDDSR